MLTQGDIDSFSLSLARLRYENVLHNILAYHHPAPIPDLHLCQPPALGFRAFSSTEHATTQGLGTG